MIQINAIEKKKPAEPEYVRGRVIDSGTATVHLGDDDEVIERKIQIMKDIQLAILDYFNSISMWGYETADASSYVDEIIGYGEELDECHSGLDSEDDDDEDDEEEVCCVCGFDVDDCDCGLTEPVKVKRSKKSKKSKQDLDCPDCEVCGLSLADCDCSKEWTTQEINRLIAIK